MKHVSLTLRLLLYKNLLHTGQPLVFLSLLKKMAFKLVLFVSFCIAQGLAFGPVSRRFDVCKNPSDVIPHELDQALHEMEEVGDTVSMAAMEAYARGNNFSVVLACFAEHSGDYIRLGMRVSEMVRDASLEMSQKLSEKAERYAKLIEPPMKNIAVTIRELPVKVHNFIKEKEFVKAIEAMKEAREIVIKNSTIIGKHLRDMAAEVPALADRAEELAKNIHKEAKQTCTAINEAFKKCVEAGGPSKVGSDDESSEE